MIKQFSIPKNVSALGMYTPDIDENIRLQSLNDFWIPSGYRKNRVRAILCLSKYVSFLSTPGYAIQSNRRSPVNMFTPKNCSTEAHCFVFFFFFSRLKVFTSLMQRLLHMIPYKQLLLRFTVHQTTPTFRMYKP